MKKESANVSSDGLAEPKSEVIDQMSGIVTIWSLFGH